MIIDVTGAGSYHGFLPALVRTCIITLTSPSARSNSGAFPLPLATALFSFLYHLASYEAGGEALVSCGMMESLLRVINWPGTELEHITVSTTLLFFHFQAYFFLTTLFLSDVTTIPLFSFVYNFCII